jgi:hypothetical protein
MENELTRQDKQRIEESIRGKYLKVAASPEGLFRYPTGRAGLEALDYAPDMVRSLPEAVAAAYCGVGNPFTLGPIREGEAILDIGCGAGVDSIIAAKLAGPSGAVTKAELVKFIAHESGLMEEPDFKKLMVQESIWFPRCWPGRARMPSWQGSITPLSRSLPRNNCPSLITALKC